MQALGITLGYRLAWHIRLMECSTQLVCSDPLCHSVNVHQDIPKPDTLRRQPITLCKLMDRDVMAMHS